MRYLTLVCVLALLAGCGGSDPVEPTPADTPPANTPEGDVEVLAFDSTSLEELTPFRESAGSWCPDAEGRVPEPSESGAGGEDYCYVKWSDLYWDDSQKQHYIWFTNDCDVAYYCQVKVTRSGRTNTYGWCVGANSSKRINLGQLEYDDVVVPSVGNRC